MDVTDVMADVARDFCIAAAVTTVSKWIDKNVCWLVPAGMASIQPVTRDQQPLPINAMLHADTLLVALPISSAIRNCLCQQHMHMA